jgi:hypothetical protein
MKKIILSAAVAAMALTTTASALEDIKVSGQAKLWYETKETTSATEMFDQGSSSGEVAFKLSMTGKQGNVGFGTTVYQTSTMGLETNLVSGVRTNTNNLTGDGKLFVGEAYITLPAIADTVLKIGKQELDTPLAFTERWNAVPNTFNAAVAINSSLPNTTLIAAYVGQDSATNWASDGEVSNTLLGTGFDSALAAAALFKNDMLAVNAWYYQVRSAADAIWIDATVNAGPVAVTGYYAQMMPKSALSAYDDTDAYAAKVAATVADIKLEAAYSKVSDDNGLPIANTSTNFKKTKLPTAGVYTDGLYVAQPDSEAFKVKASTKLGSTGLALQYVNNDNDTVAALETAEIDLIITQKVGDVNFKAILMDRDTDHNEAADGQYVRVIASVDF